MTAASIGVIRSVNPCHTRSGSFSRVAHAGTVWAWWALLSAKLMLRSEKAGVHFHVPRAFNGGSGIRASRTALLCRHPDRGSSMLVGLSQINTKLPSLSPPLKSCVTACSLLSHPACLASLRKDSVICKPTSAIRLRLEFSLLTAQQERTSSACRIYGRTVRSAPGTQLFQRTTCSLEQHQPSQVLTTHVAAMLDTLLGLPLLSAAFLPLYSNYSTSLNFLFFYLTWSTLLLSHPPLRVEAFGTLAIRLLFFILPSALFLLFDVTVPSLAVAIKAQGSLALPGRSGSKGRKGVLKVVGWSIFNVILGVALQVGIDLLATKVFRIRSALKIVTRIPLPWGLAKDIARGFILRGVSTLCFARLEMGRDTRDAVAFNSRPNFTFDLRC